MNGGEAMKVLRDKDWEVIDYVDHVKYYNNQPAFIFRHRQYKDILVLNVAKYVDVSRNIVYFFDASAEKKVCVSRNTVKTSEVEALIHRVEHFCEA